EEVWDILEEVIQDHPVLLNRAPTLHRMGIQAFEPILIEGNAIVLHPLVCGGFNADFDGDQMAVHLPLSLEAQVEAFTLMMSTNNVFSPAHGGPIITPSQDMVLGIAYLSTKARLAEEETKNLRAYGDMQEVFVAYGHGKVKVHTRIRLRVKGRKVLNERDGELSDGGKLFETTVGRVLFNDILPEGMAYYNYDLNKSAIGKVIEDCHKLLGKAATLNLLDEVKALGFKAATRAGLSFAKDDMKMPSRKYDILAVAQKDIERIEKNFSAGLITGGERYNQIIDRWTAARETVGDEMMTELRNDDRGGKPYLNPIYLMAVSGARGSIEQIRQLAGMRGLMAKPSGKIIEQPIKANFREGLKVLEYFSSTHGARKGLADTALKTADSGYLTRKLADVAQNVVVTEPDCGTLSGVTKAVVYKGDKIEVTLAQAIRGRTARDTIVDVITDEVVVEESAVISLPVAKRIEALGYEKIRVRSPLTCEAVMGVCAACYGMDLSRGRGVELGLAVGIIAAQSIGEPGTQLTMRTFHVGGTASRSVEESEIRVKYGGTIRYHNLKVVKNDREENVVLNRNGEILILDAKEREVERHSIPAGAALAFAEGEKVAKKQVLCKWDPHHIPILSERPGVIRFEDIVANKTMKEEVDPISGVRRVVIIEHKGDLHPQVVIEDGHGNPLSFYPIPEKAHVEVREGMKITAGTMIAKTPREIAGVQDITGGLPRVSELFEARKPKDPAVISEIDGVVELGEKRRGRRTLVVVNESGVQREHVVPHGKHLRVHRGDRVRAGEALVEGPLVPHDILRISGEEALQNYLLREVQNVYRAQGVVIDDKHIETIIAQMLRKVQVDDPGDSEFLPGIVADKIRFRAANRALIEADKMPAKGKTVLLGITKAALQSESFISAASFQETTKVLTEAAIAGKRDLLAGLKENV
ncbi:MAG: DNA-directed RNA polymerase subunit beta', partial [Planctomycetes bacterium]|nr:DNA-directed RNA polymerase subunit beta' [Planctomycetota bacterium]